MVLFLFSTFLLLWQQQQLFFLCEMYKFFFYHKRRLNKMQISPMGLNRRRYISIVLLGNQSVYFFSCIFFCFFMPFSLKNNYIFLQSFRLLLFCVFQRTRTKFNSKLNERLNGSKRARTKHTNSKKIKTERKELD